VNRELVIQTDNGTLGAEVGLFYTQKSQMLA